MIEHHLVVLTTDTRLLVTTERRVGRIDVVTIGPDATGLDGATEAIGAGPIPRPYARAETIERVVSDRERFLFILELGNGNHRAKNLLLEDPHLVVALEDRWL